MIIQIRGTSGSGKTTVMKRVMDSFRVKRELTTGGSTDSWEEPTPIYVEGRKKPLLYYATNETNLGRPIWILGHYESPCGGCDTIGSAAAVYALIKRVMEGEFHEWTFLEDGEDPSVMWDNNIVICEGLLLSEDVKWTKEMHDVRIVYLTTPLDQCIEQIKGRRAEAGNDKPLNVTNTSKRVEVIERSRQKLVELGVVCRRAPSEQAVKIILDWIRNA